MPQKTKTHRPARRGFTLLEIIVVVMIIAVLATLIAPKLLSRVGTAKHAAAKSKASAIAQAVELYHLEMGLSKVSDDFELELLLLPQEDGGAPGGPFLQKNDDIVDPWGNTFEILVPGNINYSYDIVSFGEDGEPGGEDINADVTQ
ncbi:MAG: type II secretion system protein GspG [Phycisphaerae bacterium]|jgi:general secretion pathway protein G|nr:type II secretion system protein GspG [Phycisphaerae bacterium]|tara:strand:- start:1540 stop:1977 length:438 start_codon:yes stop_codon:yes gene_type:complete